MCLFQLHQHSPSHPTHPDLLCPCWPRRNLTKHKDILQEAPDEAGLSSVHPSFVPRHSSHPNTREKRRKDNTNQVADVGQVLIGEDRLSIQVCHMQETGQHWLGHLISQHWPLLVDVSCAQGTVLIAAWYKLLPGRANVAGREQAEQVPGDEAGRDGRAQLG